MTAAPGSSALVAEAALHGTLAGDSSRRPRSPRSGPRRRPGFGEVGAGRVVPGR